MSELRILHDASDVTDTILWAAEETLDWFEGEPMPTEAFIDRLCDDYGHEWDIENYDCPAVRKIMRHARKVRSERS